MSADNGLVLRQRSDGMYVIHHYFASGTGFPPVDDGGVIFHTVEEAVNWAGLPENETEYGLTVRLENYEQFGEDAVKSVNKNRTYSSRAQEYWLCGLYYCYGRYDQQVGSVQPTIYLEDSLIFADHCRTRAQMFVDGYTYMLESLQTLWDEYFVSEWRPVELMKRGVKF